MEQGRVPYRAATTAIITGLAAWRAGQDIRAALTDAGYAYSVIEGVYKYITTASEKERQEIYANITMSSNKRVRTDYISTPRRGSTVPVAPSVRKYVKKCLSKAIEKRQLYGDVNLALIDSSGDTVPATSYSFVAIEQGDTNGTRSGNTVQVTGLYIKGDLQLTYNPGTSGASSDDVRILIVRDKVSNLAAPTTAPLSATTSIYSQYNYNICPSRFVVLYDKTYKVEAKSAITGTAAIYSHPFTIRKRFKTPITVRYSGTGTTYANILENNLYMIVISRRDDLTALTGNFVTFYLDT